MRKLLLKFIIFTIIVSATFAFTACADSGPTPVQPRAIFELDRVYVDGQEVEVLETPYEGSRLTFVGEENGGNVIIRVGENDIQASINPSREHPSFADGAWHHHLYAGPTVSGSPRINFMELLPSLGIDDNPEATDNTQSSYQRGNLHYIVDTGEFRLRFAIGGIIHDIIFVQV